MYKIELVKAVTGLVVGTGISAIVKNVIEDTTPDGVKTFNKMSIWVGGLVLTGMLIDKALAYTDDTIDKIVVYVNETMVIVKEEME